MRVEPASAGSLARQPWQEPVACVRHWGVWKLPPLLRGYIVAVIGSGVTVIAVAAAVTPWRGSDVLLFWALVTAGAIVTEATRKVKIPHGGVFRDMLAVWFIAASVLLPPFYALVMPIPLTLFRMLRTQPGVPHRRVFSAAANGLAYFGASVVFHVFPSGLAGHAPGTGVHVLTWTALMALCGALGLTVSNAFLTTAVGLSDPAANLREMAFGREAALSDLVQLSYAFAITLPAAISPFLLPATLPIVLAQRRFMMHAQLQAEARFDSKTGLLNAATWQQEAQIEVNRAARTRTPLAVAMVDIDHFKLVNDTHGHLTGDAVLAALSATMRALLREYDLVGRFGGEEFIILLPHTAEAPAHEIADRLREKLAQISITASNDSESDMPVRVTVSIGVACMHQSRRDLNDLIAAADAALYYAKETGRNQVKMATDPGNTDHE
jgi:diguanylate cyclase (GGDEF)-like protein